MTGDPADVEQLTALLNLLTDFPSNEQRARYLLTCNWMRDRDARLRVEGPTRASHCSCGRPARQVLDGGTWGPTGYCGVPGMPPLDPCNCGEGAGRHDRRVCHVYGRGQLEVARLGGGRG